MSELIEPAIYWTGLSVLASVGIAGAVAIVCAICALSIAVAIYYAERVFTVSRNLINMRQWVQNGKPQFKRAPNGVFVMTPNEDAHP